MGAPAQPEPDLEGSRQMHARFNTLHGNKGQVDAAVEFVEATVRPMAEGVAGNRGMATLVDREAGVTVVATYWDSAQAMADSEPAVADVRSQVAEVAGGDVSVERFEVAVARRLRVPAEGAVARMLRFENDLPRIDDTVAFYRDELVPELVELSGLCSAQLLVDRESGRAMSVTAWDDDAAVASAQDALERMRDTATERFGTRITGLDRYTMVRTTIRME